MGMGFKGLCLSIRFRDLPFFGSLHNSDLILTSYLPLSGNKRLSVFACATPLSLDDPQDG